MDVQKKNRKVDGQVCFLESKSAGLFVSLHVLSGKPSCMTICSGDSFLAALEKTGIECTFHVQIPQANKKSALRLSEIHIYICSKQKHVSLKSWNICLKRLVSHIKSISLKVPFHLMSFDPAWCLQRIFFTKLHSISLRERHWSLHMIQHEGNHLLSNLVSRMAKDVSFLQPCSKERMPTPRRGTRLLISTHVKLLSQNIPKKLIFKSFLYFFALQTTDGPSNHGRVGNQDNMLIHVQVAHPVLPKCQQLLPKWWSVKHLSVRITQNKGKH